MFIKYFFKTILKRAVVQISYFDTVLLFLKFSFESLFRKVLIISIVNNSRPSFCVHCFQSCDYHFVEVRETCLECGGMLDTGMLDIFVKIRSIQCGFSALKQVGSFTRLLRS